MPGKKITDHQVQKYKQHRQTLTQGRPPIAPDCENIPTHPRIPAMSTHVGHRLFIARAQLARARLGPDPDAPDARALQPGQARLALDRFALTANNITYAAFGEAMKYWQFFPAGDPAEGCLPVWGFADVVESLASGLDVGRRVWGY